ncbi:MAG: endonuclease/exonuclease/phosphatase family protein [Xanthobacteraceae bacterium]
MNDAAFCSRLRVMTWNIHGGVGPDRRYDLERVCTAIKRNAPDVAALQEVDSRRLAKGVASPFDLLRRAVGEHGVDAKSIVTADGEYGQMLVSRWPLSSAQVHDITHEKREPRRAIEADVEWPGGRFHVVAAHFGLAPAERRVQARRLVEIARRHAIPTVMLGDFNDWFWPGPLRAALKRELPARTAHASFPSRFPLLRLDRIFCWPAETVLHSYADREARTASDHLPIIADVVFPSISRGSKDN